MTAEQERWPRDAPDRFLGRPVWIVGEQRADITVEQRAGDSGSVAYKCFSALARADAYVVRRGHMDERGKL